MPELTSIEKLHKLFLECNQKICTDTRKLEKNSIFFALKGGNFNANEFASKAIEGGCAYAVVDQEKYAGERVMLVKDVLDTLQKLANHHRRQLNIPFIAITGSNGKTTNKELIHAVLSKKYNALATIGNLNNHIGVPLTLLSVTSKHEIAIIEMGANHKGEIDQLCRIAEPDYGLITNIGKAHLEGFGGIEGVKQGKSEMYRYIEGKKGKVFVNGDDKVLMELSEKNSKITFCEKKMCDVIGQSFNTDEFVSFKWIANGNPLKLESKPIIKTQMLGHYNFINLLCAACIGNYFGVEERKINEALSEYSPKMNRSQLEKTKFNTLILDAYNANPSSMKVAIENFSELKAENKILIIGDMFELGEYAHEEHEKIIELLKLKKLSNVILIGSEFGKTSAHDYKIFPTTNECLAYLKEKQLKGKTILIKGSRGMKLEVLKEVL